jgi:hypothetical protein
MPRTKPFAPAVIPQVRPFKQAAIESGFAYTTLRDAHLRGELAVVRVGRSWYVELAELNRFIERNRKQSA